MPEIGLHHIEQINNQIRSHVITFLHLLDELIDHVCYNVEHEMQHGLNFSEAFNRVKMKMGPH